MERAGRLIHKLPLRAMEIAGVKSYHLAPAAWKSAVGRKIAGHARPVFLEGNKLIVETDDAVWQSQLGSLTAAILRRIDQVIGEGRIERIEFRVAPLRRSPIQEKKLPLLDEAEDIEDPGMRHVYRAARRKATA